MKKASFYTLGCKVNQYETEAMAELFSDAGYEICDFNEKADIYVINTCSVTNMGDRKSRQIIRRAKKTNPNAVIAVTGCYAQTAPDEVLSIDGVNIVIGTKDRKNIVTLTEALDSSSNVNHVSDIMTNHEFEELQIKKYSNRTRAFIKIQEGCNQFCSYCIIPYARGPVRSRPKQEVIREIRELAGNGFKEIILVGIHVASYGVDLGGTSLEDLIADADKTDGVERIRLSSIEPMTLNRQFIDSIKGSSKLCHHFHISLQSSCDATLKRMNRKYTTAQFKEIVDGLREAFDDVAVTTDIMVGFPGETDEEFNATVDFIKEVSFADAHVFQYSRRRGTPAAKRPDQIAPNVKEERSKIIIKETQKTRDEFISRFIGKTMRVLFEQPARDGLFEGKTDNYITVHAPSDIDLNDQFRNVLLEKNINGTVIGKIID
ncbi:MAG: tRNA (N(6)-L-threonylcarbamoyladenosine(37)-C(2))-methylthiotransferase MtaB [Oscillospiraceae bacterium]|nr:tRNA (N(6)-L-threonylcarbamoyladenosine(37)-C(2))-methylthiotransferase MtaB [Oscillospiraceae bacterium]